MLAPSRKESLLTKVIIVVATLSFAYNIVSERNSISFSREEILIDSTVFRKHITPQDPDSHEFQPLDPDVPEPVIQKPDIPKDFYDSIYDATVEIRDKSPPNRWPTLADKDLNEKRRNAIKEEFKYAWNAYQKYSWGGDDLRPISKKSFDWLSRQATTIVDSISTMHIMGLIKEMKDAENFVETMNIYSGGSPSLFETSIRILAGLISSYDLTNNTVYLRKAEQIGDALISEFEKNSRSSIPSNHVHLQKPSGKPDFTERKKSIFEKQKSSGKPTSFYMPRASELSVNKTQQTSYGTASLAEFGLWLEFVALSDRTGDPHYAFHSLRALQATLDASGRNRDNILPLYMNRNGDNFSTSYVSIGAMGDSFFEYLIKESIYMSPSRLNLTSLTMKGDKTKRTEEVEEDEEKRNDDKENEGTKKKKLVTIEEDEGVEIAEHWIEQMLAFNRHLSSKNKDGWKWWRKSDDYYQWEHLSCFVSGNLALGAYYLNDWKIPNKTSTSQREQDLAELFEAGVDLGETCYQMYHQSPTGLAGEFASMDGEGAGIVRNGQNNLRPEVAESLFYLWRITGDTKYQERNWEIFKAMMKYSKIEPHQEDGLMIPSGYSSLNGVDTTSPTRVDRMESFFLSETLKYLYLTFTEPSEVMPLDQYVFTTEAHPLARRKYLKRKY
eukprot:MONOS_43.1-p1 / transcript=MONOS_43.1 / gene=MONOS_43 / organism=Monocercomonoides_exilis_PA203 / gene_product=mannosyl-oligosaccharide 1,2-alpha-mannosidase / transcript_product=mannosyl-oligosaccharide 1,2-alpha-mannosidase / location=Mono_scaffold00001:178701-181110(-) / protein_length=667 / sequence_SO=supercontig / SO=protein_coding / is_pseudo=false